MKRLIQTLIIAASLSSCANGNYMYSRVGAGGINTPVEWEGKDELSAHLGLGYIAKIDEDNLVDFNWTHNSQWRLGWPVTSGEYEGWLDYFGADYIHIWR